MNILRTATLPEIEQVLTDLGGGNHIDNMNVLKSFSGYFLIELLKDEFFDLVFLQNKEVVTICPPEQDRRLRAVALRAISTSTNVLSSNWDLGLIKKLTEELLWRPTISPLVLRDTRQSECKNGSWYIQDGAHRALGYAMALLSSPISYTPVQAYCATVRNGHVEAIG
jgi:hypothetical protein